MDILTIKASDMPSKQWQVGDIWQDRNKQFRINDWNWQNKEIELVELEADERICAESISGTIDTSKAKPALLLDPSKLPEPSIQGGRSWGYTPKNWEYTPKI